MSDKKRKKVKEKEVFDENEGNSKKIEGRRKWQKEEKNESLKEELKRRG